jgi:hypoxanthine phosphoribosyltransferase
MIAKKEIAVEVKRLAGEISRDYRDKQVIFVSVLRGSFMFLADLVRELDFDPVIDFIGRASYGNSTESSGVVKKTYQSSQPVRDRDVLIIEDIVDTGLTLNGIVKELHEAGARSVRCAVLLDKPSRRKVEIKADYVGFTIEDRFVVGYGLDYQDRWRTLPYVAEVVKK